MKNSVLLNIIVDWAHYKVDWIESNFLCTKACIRTKYSVIYVVEAKLSVWVYFYTQPQERTQTNNMSVSLWSSLPLCRYIHWYFWFTCISMYLYLFEILMYVCCCHTSMNPVCINWFFLFMWCFKQIALDFSWSKRLVCDMFYLEKKHHL